MQRTYTFKLRLHVIHQPLSVRLPLERKVLAKAEPILGVSVQDLVVIRWPTNPQSTTLNQFSMYSARLF